MFKRKLRIKQVATTATGDMLFTVGLGNDGNVYLWNSIICEWVLHKSVVPEEQNAPAPNRASRRKKK